MTRVKECVLYRGFEHGEILDKMTALMDACEKSAVNAKEMEEPGQTPGSFSVNNRNACYRIR